MLATAEAGPSEIERRTMRRVLRRVGPLLLLSYFVAYLDRTNVSFAAIHMNKDIGLSNAAYGLGAGLFFLSSFVFQFPSAMMISRFGPVGWLTRIMVMWGIISSCMALVYDEASFYVLRALLGAAEAGFLPCALSLISDWFPAKYRGRITGLFFAGLPISGMIGSPISGWLLSLDDMEGLHGWQWLYILEGIPAVVLAPVILLRLQDTPAKAGWLADDERNWLIDRVSAERTQLETGRTYSVRQVATNPLVLFLGSVFFFNAGVKVSVTFFLPQIIHDIGLTNSQTGLVAALPNLLCLVALILIGRSSDARQERFVHTAFAVGVGGAALLLSIFVDDPILRVAFLGTAFALASAFTAPFWAIPGNFLTGSALAAGVSVINAIGICGSFLAPWAVGRLRDVTGDFELAFGVAGCGSLLIAAALVIVGRVAARNNASVAQP